MPRFFICGRSGRQGSQEAGQKVEGVAPVQQRQRDPGREAGRSDQGKADKEPRQQDPGEMRHRSERESITGSRSGSRTRSGAGTSKGSRCGRTGKRGHRSEGNGSRIPEPIRNAHRRTERSRGRQTDTRSRKRPPRGRERGTPIRCGRTCTG